MKTSIKLTTIFRILFAAHAALGFGALTYAEFTENSAFDTFPLFVPWLAIGTVFALGWFASEIVEVRRGRNAGK